VLNSINRDACSKYAFIHEDSDILICQYTELKE